MPNYPEYVSPDGRRRLATSKADEVALAFDGWVPASELAARATARATDDPAGTADPDGQRGRTRRTPTTPAEPAATTAETAADTETDQ